MSDALILVMYPSGDGKGKKSCRFAFLGHPPSLIVLNFNRGNCQSTKVNVSGLLPRKQKTTQALTPFSGVTRNQFTHPEPK